MATRKIKSVQREIDAGVIRKKQIARIHTLLVRLGRANEIVPAVTLLVADAVEVSTRDKQWRQTTIDRLLGAEVILACLSPLNYTTPIVRSAADHVRELLCWDTAAGALAFGDRTEVVVRQLRAALGRQYEKNDKTIRHRYVQFLHNIDGGVRAALRCDTVSAHADIIRFLDQEKDESDAEFIERIATEWVDKGAVLWDSDVRAFEYHTFMGTVGLLLSGQIDIKGTWYAGAKADA